MIHLDTSVPVEAPIEPIRSRTPHRDRGLRHRQGCRLWTLNTADFRDVPRFGLHA
jgi:hypothetical protein